MKGLNFFMCLCFFCLNACSSSEQSSDGGLLDDKSSEEYVLQYDEMAESSLAEAGGGDEAFLETQDSIDTAPCGNDAWTIVFPTDLKLCQWNTLRAMLPPDGNLHGKTRLTLLGQKVCFEKNQEEMEINLLKEVEVSPDGKLAHANGNGALRVRYVEGEQGNWMAIDYGQDYLVDAEPIQAAFGFYVDSPELLSEINLGALLLLEDNTCAKRENQLRGTMNATCANGDTLSFEYYYVISFFCEPGMVCLTPYGLGSVEKGTWVHDQQIKVVDSYFRTGLECQHHGGPNQFLMILDEPLGQIFALHFRLWIDSYKVFYLDQNFSQIDTQDVVDVQWNLPQ